LASGVNTVADKFADIPNLFHAVFRNDYQTVTLYDNQVQKVGETIGLLQSNLLVVLPRFGSVRFFDHFGRTMNLTDGSVQANLVNPKLDLWFSSQGGPVPVQ